MTGDRQMTASWPEWRTMTKAGACRIVQRTCFETPAETNVAILV